ncbi:MAG: PaaI family thioesterase [Parvularculaceae bacterium]|nr:PaaI family thioesterase [Parvularculaceae bacterium]
MADNSPGDINPTIGAMLRSARDFLAHEHSLFRTLALQPVLIGRGQATFTLVLPSAFAGEDGLVHGGLSTIILDSIFGLTVFTAMEEVKPIATINLRTDHVGRAAPGARVRCAAHCDAIDDDVAYVSGRLTLDDGGALIAAASGAFMIGTKGPMKGMRL